MAGDVSRAVCEVLSMGPSLRTESTRRSPAVDSLDNMFLVFTADLLKACAGMMDPTCSDPDSGPHHRRSPATRCCHWERYGKFSGSLRLFYYGQSNEGTSLAFSVVSWIDLAIKIPTCGRARLQLLSSSLRRLCRADASWVRRGDRGMGASPMSGELPGPPSSTTL